MKIKIQIMLILLMLISGFLPAQVLMTNKESAQPGETLVALIYPLPRARTPFELQVPGKEPLSCPGVEYYVEGYGKGWLSFIPLPPDTPAGEVNLRWGDLQKRINIDARHFGRLHIPLTGEAEPEGMGDQRLYRQLARFNSDQIHWNGQTLRMPVNSYKLLSSPYGEIRTFTRGGRSWQEIHQGTDYADDRGTPCYAVNDGRVVIAEFLNSPGNLVVLEIFPGVYVMYYHLDSISVSRTQMVQRGDLIGRMGSTGKSTGPHLHFEVRVHGIFVDPQFFLNGAYPLQDLLPDMVSSFIMVPGNF